MCSQLMYRIDITNADQMVRHHSDGSLLRLTVLADVGVSLSPMSEDQWKYNIAEFDDSGVSLHVEKRPVEGSRLKTYR